MPPSASRPRICRSNLHSERHILRGFLRPLFLLCAFVPGLFSFTLSAQKRISKQLLDPLVSAILVEGEQCFRIVLETADTREVRVEAEMQGEYQDALLIQTEMLGSTLRISTGFSPHFDLPNDKLGAHKVFSVDLRVILPSHQRVTLFAGTCQVATFGKYQSLKARIDGGSFQMEHMAESTEVHTRSAEIRARLQSGDIKAVSRHGEVEMGAVPTGEPFYFLESNQGNIQVLPQS